jgi:hypothetical protein
MRRHHASQPGRHPDRRRTFDCGDETNAGAVEHSDVNRFPQLLAEATHDRRGGSLNIDAAEDCKRHTG